MLLLIPCRQGLLHFFLLVYAERTELYETAGVRRGGKLRNCLFLFSPDVPVTLRVA